MYREDAKEHLAVIQAFAEGAEVQVLAPGWAEWQDTPNPLFYGEGFRYRVKPGTEVGESHPTPP